MLRNRFGGGAWLAGPSRRGAFGHPLGWAAAACCLWLGWLGGATVAQAQDEEDEDSSSRSMPPADLEEELESSPAQVRFDYEAGLFGGSHMQTGDLGVLADAALGATLELDRHELHVGTSYLYDPFSMKAFNFAEENTDETAARLVQSMHELGGALGWDTDWSDDLSTGLDVATAYRWTELETDERWSLDVGGHGHLGADWNDEGPWGELAAAYFRRIYPDYRVADRSLDQDGAEARLEGGYSFGRLGEVGLAYELRYTDYFDARYDALGPAGETVRAEASKSYLRHSLVADGVWRPSRPWRLGLRYTFQRNDSRDYDREMTGRDAAGNLEARFLRDYYDYSRHRLRASARWHTPVDGLDIELVAEYWTRLFSTYVVRDAANGWLDEERVDHDLELALEVAYELAEVGEATVAFTALLAHRTRRSNMEREVSFATNFDVTRVFLGVEVHN